MNVRDNYHLAVAVRLTLSNPTVVKKYTCVRGGNYE